MTHASLAEAFDCRLGTAGVTAITATFVDAPTILLAGDPGTGKSAIAANLAAQIGRPAAGTGSLVRATAAASGMTLAEYNRHLATNPDADVALDVAAATLVARGDVAVFESRLSGHLGGWLRSLGRRGLISILLRCEPREQALRLLAREASPSLFDEVEPLLTDALSVRSLDECIAPLRVFHCIAARKAVEVIEAQAARTRTDRERLRALYGIACDDPSAFDATLDTTHLTVQQCADVVMRLSVRERFKARCA
ncbi:MAG: AAA family ATPase [Polyangiales bacterium]